MGKGGRHEKKILGLHLAHLCNAADKHPGPFCAKALETAKSCLGGVTSRQLKKMRRSGKQLRKEPC